MDPYYLLHFLQWSYNFLDLFDMIDENFEIEALEKEKEEENEC